MTLLVRDEADIVDAQIAFHLHAGVDFVIATDNRSTDGTTEILERYERAGHLLLLREEGDDMRQGEWVTRMARLAANEYGADWVINTDADEFWWPRSGSLKDVLAVVPQRYGIVRGCWRHFLPRASSDPFFGERMTVRLRTPAHPGDKASIYHAHQKVAHRGTADATVEPGNHDAYGTGLVPLRGWYPMEVLHFSLRSPGQLERKAVRDWTGWTRNPQGPTLHHELAYRAQQEGRAREYFDSYVVDDEALTRGLSEGSLALDTRLRDALRRIREPSGTFSLPSRGTRVLHFPLPGVVEDAALASEVSALADIDAVVRAEHRAERLEQRLSRLEHAHAAPLRRMRRSLRERLRLAPP